MQASFFAAKVAASEEEWGRLVLFGSIEEMDDQPYLMFQGSYEHTEQDVRLGQDKPYVEIGSQGWSWYGHMEFVKLEKRSLAIQMDLEAQTHMQNDGRFLVNFELEDNAFYELRAMLGKILNGFGGFQENAA